MSRRWFSAAAFPAMGPWSAIVCVLLGVESILRRGATWRRRGGLVPAGRDRPPTGARYSMPGPTSFGPWYVRRVYAFAPLELKRSGPQKSTGTHPTRSTSPGPNEENPVEVETDAAWEATRPHDRLLGVDVGSTSTKAALVTPTGAVAAGVYTRTAGKPIAAVQSLLAAIADIGNQAGGSFADHRCSGHRCRSQAGGRSGRRRPCLG